MLTIAIADLKRSGTEMGHYYLAWVISNPGGFTSKEVDPKGANRHGRAEMPPVTGNNTTATTANQRGQDDGSCATE